MVSMTTPITRNTLAMVDGLNEINAKANIDILKRTNLLVALHNFRSAVKDIYYGSEVNFIFKTKHNDEVSSEIGSVFLFSRSRK